MIVFHLFEGIVIGFLLATPVGPIGILCVRRTLTHGHREGLVVGLAGASADIVYAAVAAFGVRFISGFIADHQQSLRIAAGIVLLIVGFFTLRSRPETSARSNDLVVHTKIFISTYLLAITNPITLVGFAAVFTMLGVKNILPFHVHVTALVAGVFMGSLLWFSVLTSLAHLLKERLTNAGLARVNRIAGSLLLLFGAVAILGGIGAL